MAYGSVSYTDVIVQMTQSGWKIVTQTPDATTVEKQRGAPGMIAIPLAVIPVVGFVLAMVWIGLAGKYVVDIERKRNNARLVTKRETIEINHRDDLDLFLRDHDTKRNVSYATVTTVGLVATFVLFALVTFLR
ncbi:MAG: hypothetical protein ACOYL5_09800 [Phototrophicaceae bacterium]|jgi:phosphate/sulfate permease